MKTQIVAGHKLTLKEGQRYFASRPAARRRNINAQRFTVSIRALNSDWRRPAPEVELPGLAYDQANEFLIKFNSDGPITLNGRIW